MPMCGLRKRGYGSPHWSSSGSTEPPPSSSGLHWRTNLQLVVVLDSSLSATLSQRMTGELVCTFMTFSNCPLKLNAAMDIRLLTIHSTVIWSLNLYSFFFFFSFPLTFNIKCGLLFQILQVGQQAHQEADPLHHPQSGLASQQHTAGCWILWLQMQVNVL